MSKDIIQARYDQLETVAGRFGGQAEANKQLVDRVRQSVRPLQNGGWQGRGSSAFFAEMTSELLPAVQRLTAALDQARSVTLQVRDVMKEAEEEASRPFRSDGGEGDRASGKADHQIRITGWDKVPRGVPFLPDPGDPSGPSIHPNDLDQNSLGDCYLVAALASIAKQNPGAIRNAIRENADGTYTVTFYEKTGGFLGIGATYEPVEITVSSDLPRGELYDGKTDMWGAVEPHMGLPDSVNGEQELWPLLIEKAYGKWKAGGDEARGYEFLNKPGYSGDVMTALTGRDSEVVEPDHHSLKDLANMHATGYGLTLSSLPGSKGKDDWYKDGTLVRGHAYWVESVDEANGTLTIRNPWGYDNSPTKTIAVKYDELDDYFSQMHVNPLKK